MYRARRFLAVLLVAILTLLPAGQFGAAELRSFVEPPVFEATSNLRLRTAPNLDADSYGTVWAGTAVHMLSVVDDEWFRVQTVNALTIEYTWLGNHLGYMASDFLREIQAPIYISEFGMNVVTDFLRDYHSLFSLGWYENGVFTDWRDWGRVLDEPPLVYVEWGDWQNPANHNWYNGYVRDRQGNLVPENAAFLNGNMVAADFRLFDFTGNGIPEIVIFYTAYSWGVHVVYSFFDGGFHPIATVLGAGFYRDAFGNIVIRENDHGDSRFSYLYIDGQNSWRDTVTDWMWFEDIDDMIEDFSGGLSAIFPMISLHGHLTQNIGAQLLAVANQPEQGQNQGQNQGQEQGQEQGQQGQDREDAEDDDRPTPSTSETHEDENDALTTSIFDVLHRAYTDFSSPLMILLNFWPVLAIGGLVTLAIVLGRKGKKFRVGVVPLLSALLLIGNAALVWFIWA